MRQGAGKKEKAEQSTASLEERLARLQNAMQKQAELHNEQLNAVSQEASSTKQALDNTKQYLAKKEELEEAQRKADYERANSTDTSDEEEAKLKDQQEQEEDKKLTDDKDEDDEDKDTSSEEGETTESTGTGILNLSDFDTWMQSVSNSRYETPQPDVSASTKAIRQPRKLNIGELIALGNNTVRITNTFGIRTGENSVPGREGKHSKGVDYVASSADGRIKNVPVALAPGKIVNIGLQGDGRKIHPSQGAAYGYYMDVKVDTDSGPKMFRYSHLSPSIMENKNSLIGAEVRKGEALFPMPASGYTSTGSVTGDHVKVQVSSLNGDELVKDFEQNDPSEYI
jgi:hypothetical protein